MTPISSNQEKESVKYLGIELASAISFSSLVESVVKKAKFSSEIFVQISSCMDLKARHTLCFALFQCLFDYANLHGIVHKQVRSKKLKIIQNKMVRFINCSGPRTHVGYSELSKAVFLKSTKDQNNSYCNTCIKYIILGRIIIFDPTSILLLTYMIIIQELDDST